MKKQVLSAIFIVCSFALSAQYYYVPYAIGQNPGNLNQEGENPASLLTGWTSVWSGDATANPQFSSNITIPFAFNFNGTNYTTCKASNTGFVTFDVAATTTLAYGNSSLPSTAVSNNSVCFLGVKPSSWTSGTTTYRSTIITKTFGTAPNRQFWIQFNFFSEPNVDKGWTYWAVVLEETTNKVYIVDMKTLCVNSAGSLCNGNVKISAGIQVDGTTAYTIDGSPNLAANNNSTNLFTAEDNKFYEFIRGTQPDFDLAADRVLMLPDFALTQGSADIKLRVYNTGKIAINNLNFNYSINGGTAVTKQISGLNIAKFTFAELTHPDKFTPSATGTYNIKIWASDLNGNPDGNNLNDTANFTLKVWDDFVPRKSLHEVFTSSTCPPCKPGNERLEQVYAGNENKYTTIKYQYYFPSLGDPYFTPECDTRASYYGGVNSVPRLFVDGQWNNNPSGYTKDIFSSFQSKPSFVKIEATQVLNPADKSITINAKVTPLIDFPAGTYRLRYAIVERQTRNNVKTNGETTFNHVMKKMLPNPTGVVMTMPAKGSTFENSQSFTFPGNYRLPANARANSSSAATGTNYTGINLATEHSVEEFSDLIGVVFLQNDATKEVLQSEWSSTNWATSTQNIQVAQMGITIYPNPTNQSFTIQVNELYQSANLQIVITDINGKQVFIGSTSLINNGQIDCSHLNNGLYFVTISNGESSTTQKLIIAK
ncbi:MAG: T9SS type A sorting domain-containing protein [Bacteroidia bacterium]